MTSLPGEMTSQSQCGEDTPVATVLSALEDLVQTEEELLHYGKEQIEESVEDFVNGKIGRMFGLAGAYRTCLDRLGLKTKVELETTILKHAGNRKVREAGDELLNIEDEWDTILKNVDRTLEGEGYDTIKLDQAGPIDVGMTDARTGQTTSLKEQQKSANQSDIEAANGEVIVISFGLKEGAEKWIEETRCPFTMLLDSERKVYHTFGLKRSVYKVWSVDCLVYYAEAMVIGKELPKPYENVHDDTQQMGGDFILDKTGTVKFLYPSQTNTDRPAIKVIVDQLKNISVD